MMGMVAKPGDKSRPERSKEAAEAGNAPTMPGTGPFERAGGPITPGTGPISRGSAQITPDAAITPSSGPITPGGLITPGSGVDPTVASESGPETRPRRRKSKAS